jgi:hypothetical protein
MSAFGTPEFETGSLMGYRTSVRNFGQTVHRPASDCVSIVVVIVIAAVATRAWWRKPTAEISAPLRHPRYAPPYTTFAAPFFGSAISPRARLHVVARLVFSALKKGNAAPFPRCLFTTSG